MLRGYEPPLDDEPLTEEEMYLAADIANDCEELFYQITDEQNKNSRSNNSTRPVTPSPAGH
ncbi:hypothetical protein ACFL3Q_13825 [Planctomycetota bacterium]